jgi:hypothetical protein
MKTALVETRMKLLRGLALGALVVATTALYFSVSEGEAGSPHKPSASRPLFSEDLERLAALDEAQETQLDELSRKFIGIAAYSSKVTKAESEDLPQFLRTEIWLPGDAYPVETRDLPEFLQSELWLPGNTYPIFGP